MEHFASNPFEFALVTLFNFLLQYFLIAGFAWKVRYSNWQGWIREPRKITLGSPAPGQVRREILYSMSTCLVFGLTGFFVYLLWQNGATRMYSDFNAYGLGWFLLSLLLVVMLQDAYFYWTHRLFHQQRFFRTLHRVHHLSRYPTPWASYSFHPLEAVLHAAIVPLALVLIPLHIAALILFLLYMTYQNVQGHTGFETRSRWLMAFPCTRWLNAVTNHDMHHTCGGNHNFGLYFNYWDMLMKTNHPDYRKTYDSCFQTRTASAGTTTVQHEASGKSS